VGRLFWKFFLSILLAQVTAGVGIASVFWLREQARVRDAAVSIDSSPPAQFMLDAAAITLAHGGTPALRELVSNAHHRRILVLDQAGHDLLGRTVAPELRAQAEQALATDDGRHVVRKLASPDGQIYLVFLPREPRFGIGAPDLAGGARDPDRARTGRDGAGPWTGPDGSRAPFGGPRGPHRPPMDPHTSMLAAVTAALLASLLFAALLAWHFARPIRALRAAFDAAAGGDLAPRFADGAGARRDELSDLGRDFDRMSSQLHALMEGQRRLLHDVSHEMRSPLARLQAAIGLVHQQPDKRDTWLRQIEREGGRMDKLVGELLTLSRLDASAALRHDEIALTELVQEIVGEARFEAGEGAARIVLTESDSVLVDGDPDLLWRAIENVVRNAVKHGGGEIQIDLTARGGIAVLSVLDHGPGVADDALSAIFDPFFRANASDNNIDGHGLGLAIAARVVRAHGGTIAAANAQPTGLRVTITLPLAR
jgi:two-component system OmpR family sensor kinase